MSNDLHNYLSSVRQDFSGEELEQSTVPDTPKQLFEKWFDQAVGAQVLDPNAMSLATVNAKGEPSNRIVYLRGFEGESLLFYTNYKSEKGTHIAGETAVACTFYWPELHRQIRFSGMAAKLSKEQSDEYFSSRPRVSQISAWASQQSRELASRAELEERVKDYEAKFIDVEVPRPQHWGGYKINVKTAEFWQGRGGRLHDRILYYRDDGAWRTTRLNP